MPTVGSFASKSFTTSYNHFYTFDELSMNSDLKIEEQEVEGSKPSTYIKGQGLDKIAFSIIIIKQKNIDVKNEIDSWNKIKNAKVPYSLILGNKNMSSNKFILTNVDASEIKISPKGEFLKAKLQLQFSEFVRAGKKKEESSSGSGTSKTSKTTKKRNSSKKTSSKSSTSKSDNSKIQALEKELYG